MGNYRTAGDERRALALIQHHHSADIDGLNAILREAVDVGRVGQLIVTVLDGYEEVISALTSEEGLAALAEEISNVVGGSVPTVAADLTDDDLKLGAELILAHRRRDGAAVDEILFSRSSITATLMAACSLYAVLVPEMNTHTATRMLATASLSAAKLEVVEGE